MGSGGLFLCLVVMILALGAEGQTTIRMFPKQHMVRPRGDPSCESWKFAVEVNAAGSWKSVPRPCVEFVQDYFNSDRYLSDSEAVAIYSFDFAATVNTAADGMDAWVFDIDETLISNLPYYRSHGFGSEPYNETSFNEWVNEGVAPALPASRSLYKKLKRAGFKIFLITGRPESQRSVTGRNLLYAGYSEWDQLILRGHEDEGKKATAYKSEKRNELVKRGFRIQGSSGDQWSDLMGFATAKRSFKLPNPMYYIP